jgi:hypothetical protein
MSNALKNVWPIVPDPPAIDLIPGHIASVRTRRGFKHWKIRLVRQATSGPRAGRHYIVGMDPKGVCHVVWANRVSRVEAPRRALNR